MTQPIKIDLSLPQSPDPELFHYYKGLQNRTFYLNDEISSYTLDLVGLPLKHADESDPTKPITIFVNTPGGDVFSGLAICNIIENLKSPTKMIVLGYAYSMGAIIMIAGANRPNIKRQCYSFSTGLIHGGSSFMTGTSSQVKDFYKFQERYEAKIKDYVLKRTTFTEEEYQKIDREEVYMTAEEMLCRGLVDEIIDRR